MKLVKHVADIVTAACPSPPLPQPLIRFAHPSGQPAAILRFAYSTRGEKRKKDRIFENTLALSRISEIDPRKSMIKLFPVLALRNVLACGALVTQGSSDTTFAIYNSLLTRSTPHMTLSMPALSLHDTSLHSTFLTQHLPYTAPSLHSTFLTQHRPYKTPNRHAARR